LLAREASLPKTATVPKPDNIYVLDRLERLKCTSHLDIVGFRCSDGF
jgi:hypothetical protein